MRILYILFSILPTFAFSQTTIKADDINVNFDKAVHIVFNSSVEYVAAGSDVIEAVKVENVNNVVRIVALEENFKDATNVTIISKEGKIFSYNVRYSSSIDFPTTFFPEVNKEPDVYNIVINETNAAHIVFPEDILYFRLGNEQVINLIQTSAKNVLRIASEHLNLNESNLFCFDIKGNVYNININSGNSLSYTYDISNSAKANVIINEEDIEALCRKAVGLKRSLTGLGMKKNGYEFSLNNIFIRKEQLFFVFELKNKTNINLDIDFVKCFLIDEKELKKAALQEIAVDYVYLYNFSSKVSAKEDHRFVLVFNKFTIPDKKIFKIEIYEKGGGRHINFKLKNNTIINADII